MKFKFLSDLYRVALGKKSVPTERLLGPLFVLTVLMVSIAFIALLSSYRPIPVVRPAPQIPPVIAAVIAPAELPAPRLAQAVASIAPPAAPADEMVEYPVQTGDTLIRILRDYCRNDYLVVARENNIDPNWIYAGKTVLKFKNGCIGNAPSVLVNRNVSPRELVRNDRASSGKHISPLAQRDIEAQPLPPVAASAPAPSASMPIRAAAEATADASKPLSEIRHREIYRIVALRKIDRRTKAQNAELAHLTAVIRQEVLDRYPLPNPDCLYESPTGKNWQEQTLAKARCIRENYGAIIDQVAAENQIPAAYMEAIMIVESGGKPDAISPTGCTGLKQFTMASAKLFGLRDRFDPFESIRAGGRHLKDNLQMWKGNVARATAHFNIGSVVVGSQGFNAANFPYTQNVLRVQRLIEKEIMRPVAGQPVLATVPLR